MVVGVWAVVACVGVVAWVCGAVASELTFRDVVAGVFLRGRSTRLTALDAWVICPRVSGLEDRMPASRKIFLACFGETSARTAALNALVAGSLTLSLPRNHSAAFVPKLSRALVATLSPPGSVVRRTWSWLARFVVC